MCLPEEEMALEPTLLYPQDPFSYGFNKDHYNYNLLTDSEANFDYTNFNLENEEHGFVSTFLIKNQQTENYPYGNWSNICSSSSPPPQSLLPHMDEVSNPSLDSSISTRSRSKKRRVKTSKNKEEIENQRMTHIAVERNRRKQMNEYLSVLRSLMPESYVQRVLLLLLNCSYDHIFAANLYIAAKCRNCGCKRPQNPFSCGRNFNLKLFLIWFLEMIFVF